MPGRPVSRLLGSVGAVAIVVAVAVFSGACPSDEPGPTPTSSVRQEPRGTIRVGYPEEPPSLNPVTESAPAATDVLRAVLPSFYLVTPDLGYRPYLLAEEPEVHREGDRMEVRFRLRREARWSDGRPITVRDVAFTTKVMRDPRIHAAIPEGFDHVVGIEEQSDTRGVMVLSPPLASWRALFSAGRFVLPSQAAERPADVLEWDAGPPVSGGPYLLGRWVRGRSVELVANEEFFGPGPLVRRILVEVVPDPTTAIQLLRAGRLDAVAPMLGISWGRRLVQQAAARISRRYGADLVVLAMNTSSLSEAGVRRAIAGAIDRPRFAEVVLRAEGRVADGVLVSEQPGSVSAWSTYGGESRGRIRAGEEITLVYLRTELLDLAARHVRAELIRAGANVELIPVESDVLWRTFLSERRFDLALVEVRQGPEPRLSSWASAQGAGFPVTAFEDPTLRALQQQVAVGGPGSGGALRRAQERLAGLVPVLPLFQPRTTMGWRDDITGIEANPSVDGPFWNVWAWSAAAIEAAA